MFRFAFRWGLFEPKQRSGIRRNLDLPHSSRHFLVVATAVPQALTYFLLDLPPLIVRFTQTFRYLGVKPGETATLSKRHGDETSERWR